MAKKLTVVPKNKPSNTSEPDAGGETRKRARAKAEAVFVKADKEEKKPEKVVHKENLASDADLRRWFVLVQNEERDYEKTGAKLRAERQQAKAKLDKIYADAADVLKSRGVTKRILKAMYELSKREEKEVSEEMSASIWAMRAAGMPIGKQLSFWEDGVEDPADAYNKVLAQGRQAGLEGKNSNENPHKGHQLFGQAWMEGYHQGQSELLGVGEQRQ